MLAVLGALLFLGFCFSPIIACTFSGDFYIDEAFVNGVSTSIGGDRDRVVLAVGSSEVSLIPCLVSQIEPLVRFECREASGITLRSFKIDAQHYRGKIFAYEWQPLAVRPDDPRYFIRQQGAERSLRLPLSVCDMVIGLRSWEVGKRYAPYTFLVGLEAKGQHYNLRFTGTSEGGRCKKIYPIVSLAESSLSLLTGIRRDKRRPFPAIRWTR